MIRQIIAMGGGGFSMEPENPSLDRYILRQVQCARPNARAYRLNVDKDGIVVEEEIVPKFLTQ